MEAALKLVMSRRLKNSKALDGKSLCYPEEVIGRNMHIKVASSKVSDGNEEHLFRNLKKGDSCCKMAEALNFTL